MLESLRDAMLAQAMECFWQKGVVDHLKDATIAKLAMRVSELYGSSLDAAAKGGNSGNGGWGGGSWGGGAGSDGCELPSVSNRVFLHPTYPSRSYVRDSSFPHI